MSDIAADPGTPTTEQIPEGACHPDFDLILALWGFIAAFAWEGSLVSGPGAVVLTVTNAGTRIVYWPGSPCSCHPIDADTYDPREEAVVMVRRGENCGAPIVLVGWPAPPDAFAVASATLMQETVH
jgi:hypothetical protein